MKYYKKDEKFKIFLRNLLSIDLIFQEQIVRNNLPSSYIFVIYNLTQFPDIVYHKQSQKFVDFWLWYRPWLFNLSL